MHLQPLKFSYKMVIYRLDIPHFATGMSTVNFTAQKAGTCIHSQMFFCTQSMGRLDKFKKIAFTLIKVILLNTCISKLLPMFLLMPFLFHQCLVS